MKTDVADAPGLSPFRTLHSAFRISSDRLAVLAAIAVFGSLSALMAVKSNAFLEGDACTHFMYAREVFEEKSLLVNVWGRPICTALYALPAHYSGRTAARLTSLGVAICIALLARAIARRQGWRWPALAAIFTFAQPLVFLHSFAELTELPFALLMALAMLAYQRRRWFWLALVVGLTPLSRPEGFGFLLLAAGTLLVHGRARWWAVLVVPLIAWDVAGWWLYGKPGHWWGWLYANWPYAGDSLYSRGYLLKYVAMMPAFVGPLVFPATLIGIGLCLGASVRSLPGLASSFTLAERAVAIDGSHPLRAGWRRAIRAHWFVTDHRRRCDVLIAVLPLMVLVGHSLLTRLGKMGSNGEIRYMLVVAPFWALLSARGWGWLFTRYRWPHALAWAGLAAALPVVVNRMYTVLPQRPTPDWVEAAQIAEWYKTDPIGRRYPHIALAHPGLLYALDFSPVDGRIVDWRRSRIDQVPPGTLLVWAYPDSLFNSDATRSIPLEEIRRDGWVPMRTPWTGGKGQWEFFHSPDPATSTGKH
jgi:hypothetical protein